MHILLTDILTCPRCGPAFGLVLLADRIEERRVLEGVLGCPNCRDRYPVRGGAGSFGAEPRAPVAESSREAAVRLAALMGLTPGSSWALLAGPAAAQAPALAALLPGLEVVALADDEGTRELPPDEHGVSRIGAATRLPFTSARMGGVVLSGTRVESLLAEAARVLSPVGRLVLQPAPHDVDAQLTGLGLRLVARDEETAVAARTHI